MSSSPNATAVAEAFPGLFPKAAKNKTQKKLEFKACSSEDSNFEKNVGNGHYEHDLSKILLVLLP